MIFRNRSSNGVNRAQKYTPIEEIKWYAIITRVVIIVGQLVSNLLCPDHKASDVFVSPNPPNTNVSVIDRGVNYGLSGFLHWDAEYFYHIFRYGYIYENTIAFFPLFPLSMKMITWPFSMFEFINSESLFLLVSVGANMFFFVRASMVLYNLTLAVTKSEKFAYKAAFLFCVNPASIFFSAPYSESMFAWITFSYMLQCVKYSLSVRASRHFFNIPSFKNAFVIGLLVGASAVTRSNGLTNFAIFAHFWTQIMNDFIRSTKARIQAYQSSLRLEDFKVFGRLLVHFFTVFIMALIPFAILQIYHYFKFCRDFSMDIPLYLFEYGMTKSYVFPGKFFLHQQSWCKQWLPLGYTYVQSTYWNVGFLNYYQIKQIPNFILASPILIIMIVLSICFLFRNYSGLYSERKLAMYDGFDGRVIFGFIIHSLFLTYVCIFYIHIQVSTRFLCSSTPIVYWFCAQFWFSLNGKKKTDKKQKDMGKNENQYKPLAIFKPNTQPESKWKKLFQTLVLIYFYSYLVIGTALFSNNFPWT